MDQPVGTARPSPLAGLPERLAGAPLDLVKAVAAVLMVGDHVDTMLLDGYAPLLWYSGRIAFPLFALVLVLHLARGVEPRAYVGPLLLVGVPTQLVYMNAFPYGSTEANILFTLATGAVVAGALDRAPAWLRHLALAAATLAVFVLPTSPRTGVDFGLAGIMLPSALLLTLRAPAAYGPWLVATVAGLNVYGWHPRGQTAAAALAGATLAILAGGALVVGLAARLGRGRPRFLPRYALHLFYPGHLAVLALIRAAAAAA